MCYSGQCRYECTHTGACLLEREHYEDDYPDDAGCMQKQDDFERTIIFLDGEPYEI